MQNKVENIIKNYYFPIFIFLVIITGYLDSPIRKIILMVFPLLIITFFLLSYRFTIKIKKTVLIIGLYIGVCLVASIFAYDKTISFFHTLRILIFFLLIASLYYWMNTYKRYLLVLKSLIWCGIIISFSIFFSGLIGDVIRESSGAIRSGGIYSNVNSAGFISYVTIVSAYFQYLEKKKKIYLFLVLIFTLGLMFTGSRASILALATTIVFYNLRYKLTKKIIIILILAFTTSITILILFKEKILSLMRLNKGLSARDVLYNIGVNIAKDHPYTGIGLGNLKEIGTIYIEKEEIGNWQKNMLLDIGIQSSHNVFIETAAEIGFFGALLLILLLLVIGRKYYKETKGKSYENKNFYYLIWGIFMGILVRSFFESNGIINRGWITIDLFFWIIYVIFLRLKQWKT